MALFGCAPKRPRTISVRRAINGGGLLSCMRLGRDRRSRAWIRAPFTVEHSMGHKILAWAKQIRLEAARGRQVQRPEA